MSPWSGKETDSRCVPSTPCRWSSPATPTTGTSSTSWTARSSSSDFRGDAPASPYLSMARPGWINTLLAGLAPGVLLGTHVAGLIFFLNPHLPFSPGPVVRGVLVYG